MEQTNSFTVFHKVYQAPTGQQVVFIGMAHLWPRELFAHVSDLLTEYRNDGFTVFHEGVKLAEGIPAPKPIVAMSEALAGMYGVIEKIAAGRLLFQREVSELYSENDVVADVSLQELYRKLGFAKTVAFTRLLRVASKLFATQSEDKEFAEKLLAQLRDKLNKPGRIPFLGKALLEYRNEALVKKVLASGGHVALPWGAAHGAGIEELLLNEGFVLLADVTEEVPYAFGL